MSTRLSRTLEKLVAAFAMATIVAPNVAGADDAAAASSRSTAANSTRLVERPFGWIDRR